MSLESEDATKAIQEAEPTCWSGCRMARSVCIRTRLARHHSSRALDCSPMSDTANKLPRVSGCREGMLANRAFVVLGFIPLALSCAIWRTFAPVEGLCPLDIFHVSTQPSAESLSSWRYGSGLAVGVLLALA